MVFLRNAHNLFKKMFLFGYGNWAILFYRDIN